MLYAFRIRQLRLLLNIHYYYYKSNKILLYSGGGVCTMLYLSNNNNNDRRKKTVYNIVRCGLSTAFPLEHVLGCDSLQNHTIHTKMYTLHAYSLKHTHAHKHICSFAYALHFGFFLNGIRIQSAIPMGCFRLPCRFKSQLTVLFTSIARFCRPVFSLSPFCPAILDSRHIHSMPEHLPDSFPFYFPFTSFTLICRYDEIH